MNETICYVSCRNYLCCIVPIFFLFIETIFLTSSSKVFALMLYRHKIRTCLFQNFGIFFEIEYKYIALFKMYLEAVTAATATSAAAAAATAAATAATAARTRRTVLSGCMCKLELAIIK